MSYPQRDDHMCPILSGTIICVLSSQGKSYVSYRIREIHMCPITNLWRRVSCLGVYVPGFSSVLVSDF